MVKNNPALNPILDTKKIVFDRQGVEFFHPDNQDSNRFQAGTPEHTGTQGFGKITFWQILLNYSNQGRQIMLIVYIGPLYSFEQSGTLFYLVGHSIEN